MRREETVLENNHKRRSMSAPRLRFTPSPAVTSIGGAQRVRF
jgi:hypothetical protein